METDDWLVGWRAIGKYIGKSGRTAQRYAHVGLPFFRDPGGRPMAQKSQIDDYILVLNQGRYENKTWRDEGIDTALAYEAYKEKQRKEFNERLLEAQKKTRCMF